MSGSSNDPDFQIIGGGLIGLSTAYALSQAGAKVRVIDARLGPGEGTSYANAGMIHAALTDPWNGPGVGKQLLASLVDPGSAMKLRPLHIPALTGWGLEFLKKSGRAHHQYATEVNYALATYSARYVLAWQKGLDIQMDYQSCGIMKIFRDQKGFDKGKALADRMAPFGLRAEYLSPAECVDKEPHLADIKGKIHTGIVFPDDYPADAFKYCQALSGFLSDNGHEIIYDTNVNGLIKDGKSVIGVQTASGPLTAPQTIIAAGAHSYQLLKTVGLGLKVRPVKGYSLTFEGVENGPTLPVSDDALHAAVTPLGNRLRIAGTAEITGFDSSLKKTRLEPLMGLLRGIYPQIADRLDFGAAKQWAGHRPMSADGIPVIGKTPVEGLSVNTGQGHLGWTFSAGSGQLLADILTEGDTGIDAAPYGFIRPS